MDLFPGECFLDQVTDEVIKKAELIKKVWWGGMNKDLRGAERPVDLCA